MKLKQLEPMLPASPQPPDEVQFPSARYFQVHFEYLNQQIDSLRNEVELLKRQLLIDPPQSSVANRPQRQSASAGKIRFHRR